MDKYHKRTRTKKREKQMCGKMDDDEENGTGKWHQTSRKMQQIRSNDNEHNVYPTKRRKKKPRDVENPIWG